MHSKMSVITDRWQLLGVYDPKTGEVKPYDYDGTNRQVQRFEYSDGDLLFKGDHATLGAATSDEGWRIWKYTWDIDGNPTLIEGPVLGAWDDRASLGWE